MGKHPDYRDAPSAGSFEQELDEIDVVPFSVDGRDVAFDAEMEEISGREWPISPVFAVVTGVVTVAMTLGFFFGIPAMMSAVHSKKNPAEAPATTSPSVSAPVDNTAPAQPKAQDPITIIGTWLVRTVTAADATSSTIPSDAKVTFSANGSGKVESGSKQSPFIWKEGEQPNTFIAYGDAVGTPSTTSLGFKSATFMLNGDTVTVTQWEDASGSSSPGAVLGK